MDETDLLSELRSLGEQPRDPRAELDALDDVGVSETARAPTVMAWR